MRAYVFTDRALARHAGRFVWLSIDTENEANAEFRTRFPIPAIPTYLVIDPATERVVLRWTGGTSVEGLARLFDDAELAYEGKHGDLLARADGLYGEGKFAESVTAYEAVLASLPEAAPSRTRAIESFMFALQMANEYERGVVLAEAELDRLGRTPSAALVATSALDCALSLPKEHERRAAWISEYERRTLDFVNDASIPLAADDRSGMYGTLVGAREAVGDADGKTRVANEWATFLEEAARAAKTPAERTVFDSHYLSACIQAGDPARAIPHLEQSERDFPDDYNPPARLAIAYQYLERWDDGLAAAARAMARAYGPRKLRIYDTMIACLDGKGDDAAMRATLEEALAFAEALPEGQRSESRIAALKRRIAELG